MPSGTESTTTSSNPTPASIDAERNLDNLNSIEPSLSRSTSHDPTPYVQRARVTRAAPPKPACNPLQFIQIKPCNLYQSAQEQLKRAEEVKKVKETKKEEPEDWQSNLDNWKSCRRKRVEHIIDRVVEVKKLELEEHDRARKKSKTFSEMMEERNTKGRKVSLAVYVDDEANDLSDLGIGTSTASGKSSLSEDFDNNSVLSDNQDNEKSNFDIDNQGNDNGTREYVSSPGYDTSSTHPPSSPDLCEYTYEGAIQDYKSRVSRAQKTGFANNCFTDNYPKDSNHEANGQTPRKQTSAEIENRLSNFVAKTSLNEVEKNENLIKNDLPKVDIARRRELFEKDKSTPDKRLPETDKMINNLVSDFSQTLSIKERLMNLESRNDSQESADTKVDCLNPEFGRVKDRLQDIENASNNQNAQAGKHAPIDVPVISLKDRLSTLQEMVPATNAKTIDLVVSTEVASSDDQINKINNENTNNNNHVSESMENSVEMEETKAIEEVEAIETVDEPQPPVPDVVQEQPNRLLSTINEAIHLVEDQPENVVKRDASVSSPNLFENLILDDIVVDNKVIDEDGDDSNTNLKKYLVMDSTSDNIVHTKHTDDTTGNQVLTSAGESLCIDGNEALSDCCRQQSINDEISNKVDVMYLRSPNGISNSLDSESNSNDKIVKLVESESDVVRKGEIKLNFIEVHSMEDNRSTSPLGEEECVQNNSLVRSISPEEISPVDILEDSSTNPPSITKESSQSKNERIKCQIVGVLEKHKCPSDASTRPSDLTINTTLAVDSLPSMDQSPSKSPFKSSKTIFDFIKRNLLIDPMLPAAAKDTAHSNSNEIHSTFYVPLIGSDDSDEKAPPNSYHGSEAVDESTEINSLIDEELKKLD